VHWRRSLTSGAMLLSCPAAARNCVAQRGIVAVSISQCSCLTRSRIASAVSIPPNILLAVHKLDSLTGWPVTPQTPKYDVMDGSDAALLQTVSYVGTTR
jgi:hypothetical protein